MHAHIDIACFIYSNTADLHAATMPLTFGILHDYSLVQLVEGRHHPQQIQLVVPHLVGYQDRQEVDPGG